MAKVKEAKHRDELFSRARHAAIVQTLVNTPDLTLAEIRELIPDVREIVERVTIAELQAAAAELPAARRKRKSKSSKFATRTTEGREQIDAEVLSAVKARGEPVRAEDLRPIVGCTSAQLRRSLARLVAKRTLRRSGQARATTYALRKR